MMDRLLSFFVFYFDSIINYLFQEAHPEIFSPESSRILTKNCLKQERMQESILHPLKLIHSIAHKKNEKQKKLVQST